MENDRVRLVLYWNGEIISGTNGSQYSISPKRLIVVDHKISLTELLGILHQVTGIDARQFRIKLICRYPISIILNAITYIHVPVEDDDTLREMLCIPTIFPALNVVELYIIQESVPDHFASKDNISYKKTRLETRKAIEMVYGNLESSYTILPKLLLALQSYNPGTIVELRHIKNSIGDFNIFHSMFFAFKPCIDGFQHCRPVINIDGTFQYGKYNEKILIAVGVDAAGHILPLAFAIVDEESQANWSWFLYNLSLHVICGRQGICLISDQTREILQAVQNDSELQPPVVQHRYCLHHVKENFSAHFKNYALTKLMHHAACSHQQRKFTQIMESIRELDENAYKWLMDIPLKKWALCYDGGARYGIMTTDRYKLFNGVLKRARKLPIAACVRATFYRIEKYFDSYRTEARKYVAEGNLWPPNVLEKFLKNKYKSKYHQVTTFVREKGLYQVTTRVHGDKRGNVHTVHFNNRTCTCRKFEIYKIPCSHVMKVCAHMGMGALALVDEVYTAQKMVETYSTNFYPLPREDYWPPTPFHLVANQDHINDRPGRPKFTHIKNEMNQTQGRSARHVEKMDIIGKHVQTWRGLGIE